MEKKVVYFEKPGKENTGACLDLAIEALNEGGYRHVVVASTTGSSGLLFSGALKKQRRQYGCRDPLGGIQGAKHA